MSFLLERALRSWRVGRSTRENSSFSSRYFRTAFSTIRLWFFDDFNLMTRGTGRLKVRLILTSNTPYKSTIGLNCSLRRLYACVFASFRRSSMLFHRTPSKLSERLPMRNCHQRKQPSDRLAIFTISNEIKVVKA